MSIVLFFNFLKNSPNLRALDLIDIELEIYYTNGVGSLNNLESLYIENCTGVNELFARELERCTNLNRLSYRECQGISTLQALSVIRNLNNLTNLDLSEINPSGIGHSEYMNDETRVLLEIINVNRNLTKLDIFYCYYFAEEFPIFLDNLLINQNRTLDLHSEFTPLNIRRPVENVRLYNEQCNVFVPYEDRCSHYKPST